MKSRNLLVALAALLAALSAGCTSAELTRVKPWERASLADYTMRPDRDPLHTAMAEHVYFSRRPRRVDVESVAAAAAAIDLPRSLVNCRPRRPWSAEPTYFVMRIFSLFSLVVLLGGPCVRLAAQTPVAVGVIPSQNFNPGGAPVTIDLRPYFTLPGVTGQLVQFDTVMGKFNVELRADAAPKHVANFLAYVADARYVGSFFHRAAALESGANATSVSILQGGGYKISGTQIVEVPSTRRFRSSIVCPMRVARWRRRAPRMSTARPASGISTSVIIRRFSGLPTVAGTRCSAA
jgi:hypothetical protein